MPEFINASDSLNEGRKKLNAIAKEMNDKEVASMPEVVNARDGEPSLKARLDKEQQSVILQLGQTVKHGENESITKSMLAQDIKEEINNGKIEFKLNTSEFEDGSVTNNKIDLPIDDFIPKTFIFKRDQWNNAGNTRVSTDEIILEKGSVLLSTTGFSFSLEIEADGGLFDDITGGWVDNFIVAQTGEYRIRARYSDNREVSISLINHLSNNVYMITNNTALQNKTMADYLGEPLVFEPGTIGPSGTISSTNFRIRTPNYFQVPANTIIKNKNPETTSFAVHVEGEDNYILAVGSAWHKQPLQIVETSNIKILQRFDDNSPVLRHVLFFRDNIEIVTPDTLVRGSDIKYFLSNSDVVDNNILNPVWGHEYMFSWYDKLRKNEPVKMVWAGDSTTANTDVEMEFRRHTLGKKLLTLGGYEESLVTSINSGQGSQHTGNWLGGDKDEDKRTPNGFLDQDMQENPDLYVFSYGFNDGSNVHFNNLTWEQRIDRFEENLSEGLERIRGSQYNKSPDDMAIILTTPIAGYSAPRGNYPQVWNDKIRPIIQKACRDYKCAFVDITARQYDHGFSGSWSTFDDFTHPNETANVDCMSMFDDIIMPRLLHK